MTPTPFPLEMRGHAENGGDGDDARAAQARNQNAVRRFADLSNPRPGRSQLADCVLLRGQRRLFHSPAAHGDEARAEAFETGEVLVAGRLINAALAAEFRLKRLHGDAVRRGAAVAASLANEFVDDDARIGIVHQSALAQATLFRGAGLVVDEDGDAIGLRQFALHLVDDVAVINRQARRPGDRRRIFARLVRDERDLLDALGRDLTRDRFDRELALMLLAAGHGDDAVEENLEGDVGVGRDREANGERTGVVVGAVAEVLEHMLARRERRLADPVRALAAHMGVALGRAIHPLRHVMAADAGIGARALGHMRRGRMRTAGAKCGTRTVTSVIVLRLSCRRSSRRTRASSSSSG